jgi:predicted esterase
VQVAAGAETGWANEKTFSLLALALLLMGLLGTPALLAVSPRHEMAIGFGGMALLLALVFGYLSWRGRFGRILRSRRVSMVTVLLIAGLVVGAFVLRRVREAAVMRVRVEQAQAVAALEAARRGLTELDARGAGVGSGSSQVQTQGDLLAAGEGSPGGVKVERRFAGGDTNKTYLLMQPAAGLSSEGPAGGLLLVLPGGDGGPDFEPFVTQIYANSMPSGYLLAELVAPRWSADQSEKIVWPTSAQPWPGMDFSTEDFVEAVIDDVRGAHRIDTNRVFSLAWSSGGPAAYAASLQPGTRVRGSLIAMSVFKPELLPSLDGAEGHAYYLLQSPQDFIPLRMVEEARDRLRAAGATTRLEPYEGGHGWHGDVYGNIRRGVEWLEQHTATQPP